MTWNLTDTLNTDLNSGGLFDGLPENGKKREARVDGSQFAADTNLRADIGQSKVLDSPAESTLKSPAIFDGLPESPEKPLASARVNGSEATPTAPSLGDAFVKVRGILQKMDAHRKANDYGNDQQRGMNKAHHATAVSALMQKFGDDIENAYGIPSGDVPKLLADMSKSNAGFRSAAEIDRIHDIVKNGVPKFVDNKGNTVALPKNMSFAQAIEVDNQIFTNSLKGKETMTTASPTWNLDNALEGLSKRSALSASNMFDDVIPEKTAPQSAPNTPATQTQAFKSDASKVFSSLPEKPLASARVNGSEATPTAPSLGEIFVNVRGVLQELDAVRKANDYGNDQQRGMNKAHHATAVSALMKKFGDDIENIYGIPSGDVPQLFTDVSKSNAGFRSKEDIDRIHSIVKNGVPDFVDTKGNTVALPKNMSFAQVIEFDNQMFTNSLKGKEPVDLVKRTRELQEVLKASSDANGEPLPGQEAVYDNAHTALAQINGIPTATSRYGFGVGRLSKKMEEFKNAQAIGAASYGGVTSDQFGARISELQSKIQEQAIKYAPTFNTIDEREKWLSNRETASLPFFMSIGGKKSLVRATEDPNVMDQFVAQGKSGVETIKHDLSASPKADVDGTKDKDAPFLFQENPALEEFAGKMIGAGMDQKPTYSTASVSVPHTSLNREKTMEDIQWNLGGWVLGILIGIWVFKRVKPKTKSTTCSEMAKRWLAWGLMGSISTGTSYFFRKGGIEGVAGGLIGVIGFTSIAWVLGLVWGLMKFNLFSKTKPSPRLTAESIKQIQDQAMRGDGKAQFELGSLLYYGESLIKNQVEAYKWILLAQAQGITTSKKLCLEMERKLSRPEMAAGQGLASSFIVNDALPHMKASDNETVKKEEKTPPQLPNSQNE